MCIFTLTRHLPRALGCVLAGFSARLRPGTGPRHGAMIYMYPTFGKSASPPTGTIAFMMDCDTTGIEPDISLIKYKKLVGGGVLKIVNTTVPEALDRHENSNRRLSE